MSRRQKRKSIRTMLLLGVSGTALASLVATLVYAYSPRLANWQLSPQDIAEASDPSSPSAKNGWTSRLMPPLPAGEGNGSDMTVPTNSEIQVAGLEPGSDTVTTGTGEGNPSTGGPGSVGGTFDQTYGNGPQFGGMGGQGGSSGFGGGSGPGGNTRPMAFGAPSSGGGGGGSGGNPPAAKSPDEPGLTDPDTPPEEKCVSNCEVAHVPDLPGNPPGNPPTNPPNNPPENRPDPPSPPGPTGPTPPGPVAEVPTPPGPGPSNPTPPTFAVPPPVDDLQDPPTTSTNGCTSNCEENPRNEQLVVAVPEPGALGLFLMGLAGIGLALRRRA